MGALTTANGGTARLFSLISDKRGRIEVIGASVYTLSAGVLHGQEEGTCTEGR